MPNSKQSNQIPSVAAASGDGIEPAAAPSIDSSCQNQSTTHFALVLGNSYDNTISGRVDAEIMARHLCQLGYSVDTLYEGTFSETIQEVAKFKEKIKAAQRVVFFYSGHGFEIEGENCLLPTDLDPSSAERFELRRILDALNNAPKQAARVVFLDACRTIVDLPEGIGQGLVETHGLSPTTLISYAAEHGRLVPSANTPEELSPYSKALAASIREPGLTILELLARVNQAVRPKQTPIFKVNPPFPEDFCFKEAIPLPLKVDDANDQLFVFHNGALALAAGSQQDREPGDPPNSATLALKGGKNELLLKMFNARNFRSGQHWLPTDGWRYRLDFTWPADTVVEPAYSAFLEDHEETPFKAGPHHGQVFDAATVDIHVHPETWVITVTVDKDLWKNQPPLWAREQQRIWSSSIADLPLDRRPKLKQLTGMLGFVKSLIEAVGLSQTVDIPSLKDLYVGVYGHKALEEPVAAAMGEIDQRLDDLEASVKIFLEGSDSRPFASFDRKLSASVKEKVVQLGGLFASEDVVRVWTAFEEGRPGEETLAPRRRTIAGISPLAGLLGAEGPVATDDALFVPREGEVMLGPISHRVVLEGIAIEARLAAMLSVGKEDQAAQLRARLVVDLADLDAKIGQLVQRIPLPKDRCAQRNRENLVVEIQGSDLRIRVNQAIAQLHGNLQGWLCPSFLPAFEVGRASFDASLPMRLKVQGPISVSLEFDRPDLRLEEPWRTVLQAAGVDLNGELERLIRRALPPAGLQVSIPPEFVPFGPRIVNAFFFGNAGTLAAEVDLRIDLPALGIGDAVDSAGDPTPTPPVT